MTTNKRNMFIINKTDFNHHNISQLSSIYKCCKCKRNNNIIDIKTLSQNCFFCGTPNYIKKERK